MKRKILISMVGFTCSFLVAMGIHFRSEAIRHSPNLVADSRENSKLSKEDFLRDIQKIHDEIYDPIRPVSRKGSFLLILEKAAYAAPGALFSSLLAPTFLPTFAYAEQFRQDQRSRLPLGATLPSHIESSAQLEGFAWGVGQGIAFYLPFVVIRKWKIFKVRPPVQILQKFKRWLRRISPPQAAIFYMWTAFCMYVVILHNPTGGYYGDWWNPWDWSSKNDLPAPDLLRGIGDFSNLIIIIGIASTLAAFGIWLTGIRAQIAGDETSLKDAGSHSETEPEGNDF